MASNCPASAQQRSRNAPQPPGHLTFLPGKTCCPMQREFFSRQFQLTVFSRLPVFSTLRRKPFKTGLPRGIGHGRHSRRNPETKGGLQHCEPGPSDSPERFCQVRGGGGALPIPRAGGCFALVPSAWAGGTFFAATRWPISHSNQRLADATCTTHCRKCLKILLDKESVRQYNGWRVQVRLV